ncbi:olfactory receptor 52E4-like [Anguilla anguilla]|uniref:olfactory receptor 52E4-like n=1 Tax=Anguilla anguilla TaxID=7936 RepID=UPI0015AA593C|nr:olfactory receptor 52E4-like [Anguilla anguilla]
MSFMVKQLKIKKAKSRGLQGKKRPEFRRSMMEGSSSNGTFQFNLKINHFDMPPVAKYSMFFLGLLIYLFSVFCNLTILVLIVRQRNLHKPMFIILFSLPLNDLMGITVMLPRVLADIVTLEHSVYYPTCVLQAFLLHMYGGGILFLLAVMALDRYAAICKPLRYNSIMTPFTLFLLIASAWGLDLILVGGLFILQVRLPRCRNFIRNVFCDNPSLVNLSCDSDLTVNNIYGLAITAAMQIISVSIQLFSYIHILVTCLHHRQTDARSKALNTCLTQIAVFLLFECATTVTILSYRFKDVSANLQKVSGMLIFLILPVCNPVLYGIKNKELRETLLTIVRKQKVASI